MAYALFCQDSKISRSYQTWAEVWEHASDSGLVVDLPAKEESKTPKQILSNDYEIRSCASDPDEKPDEKTLNKFKSIGLDVDERDGGERVEPRPEGALAIFFKRGKPFARVGVVRTGATAPPLPISREPRLFPVDEAFVCPDHERICCPRPFFTFRNHASLFQKLKTLKGQPLRVFDPREIKLADETGNRDGLAAGQNNDGVRRRSVERPWAFSF